MWKACSPNWKRSSSTVRNKRPRMVSAAGCWLCAHGGLDQQVSNTRRAGNMCTIGGRDSERGRVAASGSDPACARERGCFAIAVSDEAIMVGLSRARRILDVSQGEATDAAYKQSLRRRPRQKVRAGGTVESASRIEFAAAHSLACSIVS